MVRITLTTLLVGLVLFSVSGHTTAQDDRLTETFVSSNGSLTFNHPAAWQVVEYPSEEQRFLSCLYLSIIDMSSPQLFFGEGYMLNASNISHSSGPGPWLYDNIPSVIKYFAEDTFSLYGEIQTLTLGEKEAGYATISPDVGPLTYIVVVAFGGDNYFVSEISNVSDQEVFEDIFFAVLATMRFELPIAAEVRFPDPVSGDDTIIWQIGDTGGCSAVAVGPDDTLYLSCIVYYPSFKVLNGGIVILDADGHVQSAFSNPDLSARGGITLADDGTLWIADVFDMELHHFSIQGDLLGTIKLDHTGTLSPYLVELDQDGYLVSLSTVYYDVSGVVMVHSPDGEKQREFTVYEEGVFEFRGMEWDPPPPSLALGPDGRMYVATANSSAPSTLRVFDAAGSLLDAEFAADLVEDGVKSVYVAPDERVYILSLDDTTVYRYTLDGEQLDRLELPVRVNSFLAVQPLAMLSDGSLVILGDTAIMRLRFD